MADKSPAWNTTCAIWHEAMAPAAPPVATGVPCRLEPDPVLDSLGTQLVWTHRLLVPAGTDLRDGADGGLAPQVAVPDAAGTRFEVRFVAVAGRGGAGEHKVARLRRLRPDWPTDNI
ncbi:MAG: hypothetical protein KJS91_12660 [Planctomycetes bacterium]|jgi:hypothetical protein|nr:hypothetical protein [Planctomycetota bacterium]MBU6295526.1 hypothetical protein [Planctomycetota bacterium]